MMKPGLLERIQTLGHWRVVFRPLVPLSNRLTFRECADAVEQNRVSLRGWDFPHVSHRQDDQGGSERGDGYLENWCDWYLFLEFWRMYRSGQFLSYNAVHGDSEVDLAQGSVRWLNVVDTIYTVSEFVEFAHRLACTGLYRDGYLLDISLRNTDRRRLDAGRGRMPFMDNQSSNADMIQIERRVDLDAVEAGAMETSLSVLIELFDAFGWKPDPNQIRADQEAFYRREFR
jgi:hypothetical protein